ncbi:helix-turn-helix domain-containing protein [Streptomyces sp. 5-8]|uniref:Helix-turn-helix domain-containing protein n=1 Tax=Streptomyces musisoli TaxID=2802280 RepID=A0ABS1P9P0_9ACTN|nr:helix-turn-helix domain-containing protein [Streptomyces musisoli]
MRGIRPVGRRERPVDPGAGPVQRFAYELRKLRQEAGGLTYREMARRAHYSVSALSQAAAGEQLPSLDLALAYARACDGDVEEWERRWHETAEESAVRDREDGVTESPYLGLVRFEPDDHERFFGRDQLVADAQELVLRRRFVAVVGPSGSGKSSLLRAGLIPKLRAEGPSLAAIRILTPGDHPLRTHAEALQPKDADGDTVLVVDQFEEVFTLGRDPHERTAFIDALLAARHPDSRLRVVIAVRADFYGRCAEHGDLAVALREANLLVGPMSPAELREAVVRPAQTTGLIVERGLTARLVEEVHGTPGGLPLLSHALRETWRRRRGRALTMQAYEAAGGVHGAIAQSAEEVYTKLSPGHAELARLILLRLIVPGEDSQDTGRPVDRSELDVGAASRHDIALVLERLANARLLTLADGTVDLAHEALITGWPRLHEWIDGARARLRLHRQLTEAASEWKALDRDPGALYRGVRLAAAEEAFRDPDTVEELTRLERNFLTGSITARERERRAAVRTTRRRRQLIAALSVLLVVAMTAGAIAWSQTRISEHRRQQAVAAQKAALSRQLAARSAALLGYDPDLASLLAVQAYRISPTAEATSSLYAAAALPVRQRLTGDAGPVEAVAFSPDGRTVAAGGSDGTILRWDTGTGTARTPLRTRARGVRTIAYGKAGHLLVAGHTGGTLRLSNPTRRKVWTVTDHAETGPVAFSPDGRTVAVASSDGTVRLRHVATGALRATLLGFTDTATMIAYSPDGRLLAAGGSDGVIRVRDLSRGTTRTIRFTRPGAPVSIAFSPNGKLLAAGDELGDVQLSDTGTGSLHARFTGHKGPVRAVRFSPDGRLLATGSADDTARLYDVTTGESRAVLKGHTGGVTSVSFSPDGTVLATGSRDRTVRLWDTRRGAARASWKTADTATSMVFTTDGRALETGDAAGGVSTWDTAGQRTHGTRTVVSSALATSVSLPPDGHVIAALTDADGRTVQVWDATDHMLRTTVQSHSRSVALVTAALDPDGRVLATGDTGATVRLWDVATGKRRAVLTGHTGVVAALAFSGDGHTLASADASGTIRLWDVATGRSRALLTDNAASVALSADGRTLAVGHDDGTVRLWDVSTLTVRDTLRGRRLQVSSMAMSSDQRTLAAGSGDGTIQLWKLTVPSPTGVIDRICHALHRGLSRQEQAQYLPGRPQYRVCTGPSRRQQLE